MGTKRQEFNRPRACAADSGRSPPQPQAASAEAPTERAAASGARSKDEIAGFIPDDSISRPWTDPANALAFWHARGGEVVYKPFLQTLHSWRETRRLREEDLALIENVRLAPVIFQSLVPGVADLRVTVIGDEIFPAAVNLDRMGYKLDVRLNQQSYAGRGGRAAASRRLTGRQASSRESAWAVKSTIGTTRA